MMGRRTRIAQVVAAALLVGGLAACSDDEKPKDEPAPTAWSAADATNTSDAEGEKAEDGAYKVVKGDPWTDLKLPDGGKSAMVDPETWPDVQTVLSIDQIDGIFPEASLGQPKICAFGSYNIDGGGQTPKNAQCSWDLDGERVRLTLRGIGADGAVVKSWDEVRTKYRDADHQDDRFYRDGTYGARRALFLSDGLGSFVVSDGEVAAWFDVQYPEDTDFLVDGDEAGTQEAIRTKSFPTMIETFVAFLPREH